MKEFYVYEWYIKETGEVFYIGKGTKDRYKEYKRRNKKFKDFYNTHECDVRIVKSNLTEEESFKEEVNLITYYKNNTDYRLCNMTEGGTGGNTHKHYSESEYNDYKCRLSKALKGVINQGENNPMHGKTWMDGKTEDEIKIIAEKQRIGNLGQKRSSEAKLKMSISAKNREYKLPPPPKKPCMIANKKTQEVVKLFDGIRDAKGNGYVVGNLSRKAKGVDKNKSEEYIIFYTFYNLDEKETCPKFENVII